jgi:hypothetical protein
MSMSCKRAYGAHLNGLEAFPPFAAAVITATQRGVPQSRLDWTALAWLGVRVFYTGGYLGDWAGIRPVLWAVSVLISIGVYPPDLKGRRLRGENLHLARGIADALPGARVLPGRFNVVGVRKRAASALALPIRSV